METKLAKKRGKMVDVGQKEEMDHVDELYTVPDHLKVCFWPNCSPLPENAHSALDCNDGTCHIVPCR